MVKVEILPKVVVKVEILPKVVVKVEILPKVVVKVENVPVVVTVAGVNPSKICNIQFNFFLFVIHKHF